MSAERAHPVAPATRIIPMIGHPIAQVKSLAPINAWFAARGIDCCMMPVDVLPERVAAFFDAVRGWENCTGVSITLPHKQAAFAVCNEVTGRARMARAVNIVRRDAQGWLHGDMTDGAAFCAAIEAKGYRTFGAAFLLIGAGGAGSAVAHAMAEGGAKCIIVIEIDALRRQALLESLRAVHPAVELLDHLPSALMPDVVLNATPLGMHAGDALPFSIDSFAAHTLVADAVTKPIVTPFLEAARSRGLAIQTGEDMALAQLSIQLPIWGFKEA